MKKKFEDFFSSYLLQNKIVTESQLELIGSIESEYLSWFLSTIIQEIEEIMAIDARLPLKNILEMAADRIVQNLAADAATIRVFDPVSLRMVSFGAFGVADYERSAAIDVQDSLSGKVVQERRSIAVPNILKDPLYKNKSIVKERGFHSLLAVPLVSAGSTPEDSTLLGALQIYYRENDREFDKLEIIHAELLARRISFVLAKKKIFDLEQLNIRKETIINKIFVKLSRRENIKIKDLFVHLIPELEKLLDIKSCSLFRVSEDQQFINMETSYPQEDCYYDAEHSFTVENHPNFKLALHGSLQNGDFAYERITDSYILIKDPVKSALISDNLRKFAWENHINSILLIPLRVEGRVSHLLEVYAAEHKEFFADEDIELLTFFGKEIMKATRLEFLGDVLHDIKNPAIAVAGFANRARKLMKQNDLEAVRGKLVSYLDIIASEASRMQDLAQATSSEGREELLELAQVARRRYQIIREVVAESKLSNVRVLDADLEDGLTVSCPLFGLERVLDNLLGNAARAVPSEGGTIALGCFRKQGNACLSVENSGEIPPERLEQIKKGLVKGKGLNIVKRFVHANHGNMDIKVQDGRTCFTLMLPLASTS